MGLFNLNLLEEWLSAYKLGVVVTDCGIYLDVSGYYKCCQCEIRIYFIKMESAKGAKSEVYA